MKRNDSVFDEDGNPRTFYDKRQGDPNDVKTLRLCGQVARALGVVFGGLGDEVLSMLGVQSVTPAPTSNRLLVTVYAEGTVDPSVVLERLKLAKGLLRSEVASVVQRKRAPELAFKIVLSE